MNNYFRMSAIAIVLSLGRRCKNSQLSPPLAH
ncbi:hypothetical protein CFBP6109_00412 [Pseudomonas syringae pv. cerasicola]|nr:hypothetical protein CFBP6109_00412 [Pseudomonas syringae pv. cerasicola]SPF12706.1 hypothetical protein PSCFBP6110_00181 [Pseudomonas syringae pv. cerasicola]